MLTTAGGRTIRAEHQVSSPRPYSRINAISGSRGIFEDYDGHRQHRRAGVRREACTAATSGRGSRRCAPSSTTGSGRSSRDDAEGGGHGGMDYILQWRSVQQIRAGLVPDIDVYDSAVWCAPGAAERRVARQGRQTGAGARLHPGQLVEAPARAGLAADRDATRPLTSYAEVPVPCGSQPSCASDGRARESVRAWPSPAHRATALRRSRPTAADGHRWTISPISLDGPAIADVTVTVTTGRPRGCANS